MDVMITQTNDSKTAPPLTKPQLFPGAWTLTILFYNALLTALNATSCNVRADLLMLRTENQSVPAFSHPTVAFGGLGAVVES